MIQISKLFNTSDTPQTYIIAEIGINHEGSFSQCIEMIQSAYESGADGVKLQTIDPEKNYHKKTESYALFKKAQLSLEETKKIFEYCHKLNIEIFTTVGDLKTLSEIESLNPSCYKISSGLLTCTPIIKRMSNKRIPIILSTGMANLNDIENAFNASVETGFDKIAILQCTSIYPAKDDQLVLSNINWLANKFKCLTGFSDHSIGVDNCVFAVASGARIIEKHFTFNDKRESFDHYISLTPPGFKNMVEKIREMEIRLGRTGKEVSKKINDTRNAMCRHLATIKPISKGECFTIENTGFLRFPINVNGLEPSYFEEILGKKTNKDLDIYSLIETGFITK